MSVALATVVAVDAVAWCAAQVTAGYAVHRLADHRLDTDGPLLRIRAFERDGRLYRDVLRVPRWKRLLPEGGAIFRGGYDKRTLPGAAPEQLARYGREARRAELGHWMAMAPLPLFALWNPPVLWPAMVVYAVAVNGPCIASQRYNRLRIERVLARASGSRPSPAPRRRSSAGTIGSSMP